MHMRNPVGRFINIVTSPFSFFSSIGVRHTGRIGKNRIEIAAMFRRSAMASLAFVLGLVELAISSVMHLLYAASISFAAVLADLAAGLFSFGSLLHQRSAAKEHDSGLSAKPAAASDTVVRSVVHERNSAFFEGRCDAPIVLVHGIFGFGKGRMGGLSYWAGAEEKDNLVFVPDLGSLTSIHDRARELFYYLKGGTVDYGIEHSEQCGHSQYGHVYKQGHYREWDEDHPIHFVGHSTGAQVIRVLQQMLADKKFEGYSTTNADWVLSLTSLSGVFNGTTRVYLDGVRPENGQTISTISLLQLLRIGAIIYEWLDISLLKRYYSFGFDHYNLSWRKSGIRGLVKALLNLSGPFAYNDWVIPDLSIQSSVELNKSLKTHPNTYYFSYATTRTRKLFGYMVPAFPFDIHPLFCVRALQMCLWKFPAHLPLPYDGYKDEDWQDNDGCLNTISMMFPRFPVIHPNSPLGPDCKDGQVLQPGIWYYTLLKADHLYFIINRERAGIHFDIFYDGIFQRCRQQFSRRLATQ